MLTTLEEGEHSGAVGRLVDDLPLFQSVLARRPAAPERTPGAVETTLAALNPDELSPREALERLYELRALLQEEPG